MRRSASEDPFYSVQELQSCHQEPSNKVQIKRSKSQPGHSSPSPMVSLLISTFILSFLLISLFVIRVGPFLSLNEESSYHGTQLSTLSLASSADHLFWIDDDTFIYYDEIHHARSYQRTHQERYRDRLKRLLKDKKKLDRQVASFEQRYAVIFDAGSTGTRVSIVVFNVSHSEDTAAQEKANLCPDIILDKTFFAQVKPGLSSYADNPSAAAQSIDPLLSLVNSVITEENLINQTPLLLKATAGLRLLPGKTADLILASVKDYLMSNYSFLIGEDSVSISWMVTAKASIRG